MIDNAEKRQFEKNPNVYIEKALKQYVRTNPNNRLKEYGNEMIWDEPLAGFASGDDPLFMQFKEKEVVGEFHLTPGEMFSLVLKERNLPDVSAEGIRVMSFVLPFMKAIRDSERVETKTPSILWNNARKFGQLFLNEAACHIAEKLESLGFIAFVPAVSSFVKEYPTAAGGAFNWSERHAAYAAGLGTFSLNDGFITPKGIAMRAGSVVTDAPFTPCSRPYHNHMENCLYFHGGACRACIDRCPVNAISEKGHDKLVCREYMFKGLPAAFKELDPDGTLYQTDYGACGLCQAKVPCEAGIPRALKYNK